MNLDLDDYFKVEMEVRDELSTEIMKDISMIYGNSSEILGAVRMATLKALLIGPYRMMKRRQQNV